MFYHIISYWVVVQILVLLVRPLPIPVWQKCPARGTEQIEQNIFSMLLGVCLQNCLELLTTHFTTYTISIAGDGWNKYWSLIFVRPLPIPIPDVAKVPCQGRTN